MVRGPIEFGPFRLETDPDRLWQGSERVSLRAKGLSVLSYLARRPGRLVTKEELREQVWGATLVSDTTLRVTVREIRAALGDDPRVASYIETEPARGYRFLARPEMSSDLERSAIQRVDQHPAVADEPIVGRQREIEYLMNRFLEADKGRRQIVFLAGEPGAGKTTLIKLLMERLAERPEATTVGAQCAMSFGTGEAYGPMLEALGRLATEPGGGNLIRLLDDCAPMWLVQLPAFVESAKLEGLQNRVLGATRERMIRELNDVLERVTTQATLVLILEDLHWSDTSTIGLLTSIAQHSEAARLLIVGTYRPAEAVVHAPALCEAIRELKGRGLCEHFDLEHLTRRDVGAYAAARLGGMYSEDAADLVFLRSGGNALFMVNVLDHLMQAGVIRNFGGRWSIDGAADALSEVPEGLRPFIQRRLDTLSAEERRALETASVIGVEFAAAALSFGTSSVDLQQDPEDLEIMLEALLGRTRLIVSCGVTEWPDGSLSSCYQFSHALYREVLYQDIPEARRARLHRMIGEHLRVAFGPEEASLAAVLAVHFENGQDAESAARYRRMAGERALGRHAYRQAAEHLEKALDAFDQAGSRPADADSEDRVRWELDVCTTLGMALAVTHGHGAAEVRKAHARALPLIEGLDDPATQFPTLFNLWSVSTSAADLTESKRLVTRMSEVVARADNDEMALMFHAAKLRIAFFHAEYAESADSVRQTLTLYDTLRDHGAPNRYHQEEPGSIALGVDAWRLWLQGCPAQAATRDREARELARHLDSPYGRAFAWAWSLASLQFRGETTQLERRASDLYRHCTEHGFPTWAAWATFFDGWVVGARANEADGIALMEKGLDGWKGAGIRVVEPYLLALLSETCLRAGRIEAASERLAEARDRVEKTGECWWEAELHRLEGEVLLAGAEAGGHDGDRDDRAEGCFRTALEVARRQQARSLELRAALSLSRLWGPSRSDEARRLLGGVLEAFTEGHDTPDLRAAQEQMAQLSQVD